MPDFPRYHSKKSLTTKQPRAFRQDADIRTDAADRSSIASKAITAVQDTARKWNDALVTSQLNAFKANKGLVLADIKSRARLDPDQNATDKYLKEIDDYSKTAFKSISEQAKREAQPELSVDTTMAKIQINSIFKGKIITEATKNLTMSLEGYYQDVVSTGNVSELGKSYKAAYQQIDENIATDIISPDEGTRLKEKFDEDVRVGLIDRDLYSNPTSFRENINAYEFKDAKERSDKKLKADRMIKAEKKKIQWEETQINTLGAYDLSNAMLNGTLTHDMIKNKFERRGCDFETSAIFDDIVVSKANEFPEPEHTGKPDFFIRLLEEAGDDKTESLTILKHAAKAYANKSMGTNQYAYFINKANDRFQRQKKGEGLGDKLLQGAVEGIMSWVKSIDPSGGTLTKDILRSFIDKLQSGTRPTTAAEEVKTEAVLHNNPYISNAPKEGRVGYDKHGNKIRVFPDGTYRMEE